VCGHARDLKYQRTDQASRYRGDTLTDQEGRWFIGEYARLQLSPGEILRLRGRTSNQDAQGTTFRLRMAKAALGKLLMGIRDQRAVHVRLATGLPVDHMRDAPLLKAALLGQHRIESDVTDVVANITEVIVMPQPYGTVYAQMLTSTGDLNVCHTYQRTGVCDVGTYTIDLTLDDDGQYVEVESGSTESGVYLAQERITMLLEERYREKPRFSIVEEVLRSGCFRDSGEPVDMHDDVQAALDPIRSATLNLIAEKWKSASHVDVIYLSGGGAELVYPQVKSAYRQAHLVQQAQLANARGYLQFALYREHTS
jgi:hypothetical protein